MLKNIQIKIVLIFLILGIAVIAALGYINYYNLQVVIEKTQGSQELYELAMLDYQSQVKITTIYAVIVFTCICVLVRYICYK